MNDLKQITVILVLLMVSVVADAASPAEQGLYWSISRDGEPAGFLLGTIHSEDPRVLDFPEPFIEQLTSNQFFAMEMVPDLPTITRLTEYMHYQDGSTLESHIGAERYAQLELVLRSYSVPLGWIRKMKVWAAMMTLSTPPPQTGLFMDFSLSLRAAGSGLKVVGMETLEQQLSFLENMPMALQLNLLDQALEDHEKVDQLHRDMVDIYLTDDLDELLRQTEKQLGELDPQTRAYFIEKGINDRNIQMMQTLIPQFQLGRVFVALGALHLPGESGLIELLRGAGFEVTPLPLPLLASEQGHQADDDGTRQESDSPHRLNEN